MPKRQIKELVYIKQFTGEYYDVRFSDLPKDIQDNDIINIIRDDGGSYDENEFYNPNTQLHVIREREETDEEYQQRITDAEHTKEELRKRRYENYLKLKSEFEPES